MSIHPEYPALQTLYFLYTDYNGSRDAFSPSGAKAFVERHLPDTVEYLDFRDWLLEPAEDDTASSELLEKAATFVLRDEIKNVTLGPPRRGRSGEFPILTFLYNYYIVGGDSRPQGVGDRKLIERLANELEGAKLEW